MEHISAELRGMAAEGAGEARTDVRQRAIVDDGIALQFSANTMSAVEYLRSRDVGRAVIERVLLEPFRHRSRQ